MPPGAKKRKAAKKKQQQQQEACSPQANLISTTNHDDDVRTDKELELDTDERIEITDSSRDHDKNSSSGNSSSSSSSSDDESNEVKKKDDNKETGESVSEAVTVISVPNQPIPIAGDAPFMGTSANVIVESCGLIDSTTPSDPNTEKLIEISNENGESSLPKPNEITPEVSLASDEVKQSAITTDKKESEGKIPQGSKESELTSSHEEEASVLPPTHGVAHRTSWLSCCGLFDVVTGSSR